MQPQQTFNPTGIWHSKRHYVDSKSNEPLDSEHDAQIFRTGNDVIIQSIPDETGSYILLRLTMDGEILTGTWSEHTSPTGPYQGIFYTGGVQLKLSPDGSALRGRYVGISRSGQIKDYEWEIVRKK